MSLDDLKEQISRGALAVHDMAERLKEELDDSRERHHLRRELDLLFMDLGIEVYQRMRQGDPVEDSVVVQDIVDRLAQVELRMARIGAHGDEPPEPEAPEV
ncbi:MAG: hypothetical protein R3185_08050 [Candidatus Thermoplasmatota archaeon]|nr:hypothetical protein [Candidatus Thermoplasmatota archaeon]